MAKLQQFVTQSARKSLHLFFFFKILSPKSSIAVPALAGNMSGENIKC